MICDNLPKGRENTQSGKKIANAINYDGFGSKLPASRRTVFSIQYTYILFGKMS